MPVEAPQRHVISTNETRVISVDFKGKLDSGELLTGSPTVTEVTTGDLTISGAQVSTTSLVINDRTVAIGEAVLFTVAANGSGLNPGDEYTILIICGTDASQTIDGQVVLTVI